MCENGPKITFFKISKNKKMRFFLMSQGSFSQKIRFLGQKVCSVARRQTDTKVKMVLKIPFFKISKNKKMSLFLMSQGSFSPKIRFLGQKVCSVDRTQTDRQTDRHESEYRGHPFRVSGFFKFSFNLSSRSSPITNFGLECRILYRLVIL